MWRRRWSVVDWQFTALLLSNGVLIGLMYSLIALGFVLVYKATDAVNFAQGEFVMIAGFVAVGSLTVAGLPLWAFIFGPLFIPPIQLVGGIVSLVFLAAFGYFFLKSRKGVAMRAVADNQQVAMAMGINVERYFGQAWAMTGIVSALGGVVWGNLLGVDVHLSLVGFKVFPVVILGGLDSIPGAILGGLIVGIVENVAAGYVDPYVGGGTKDFAPYVLMILALMIRPYGIFGKRIIERV